MIEPIWILLGLLLPCAVAAGSVYLLRMCQSGPAPKGRWLSLVSILGIAIAVAAGMVSLTGLPPWKPIEGQHWILMVILPASLLVAMFGISGYVPGIVVWPLRLIIACGMAPLLTRSLVPYTWNKPEATAWWIGIGLWISLFWFLMRLLSKQGRGQLAVCVLGGVCGILGGITIASGSLTGGQYAASLAFVLLGVWLVMLLCRNSATVGPAVVDLAIAPILGWLIYNWQYGWTMENDVSPYVVAGLLAVAPLGAWVSCLPAMQKRSKKQQIVAALLATGFLLAIAVGIAGYEAMLRMQESTDLYGY